MKKTVLGLLAGVMVLALAYFAAGQTDSKSDTSDARARELKWYKYDRALEIANENDKHVFVFFTTAWCSYCRKMELSTFPDPEVFALLTEKFTLAKVDGESRNTVKVADKDGKMVDISERQLTQSLGVRGFPTMVFLKSDGTGIAPLSGYLTAEQFAMALKYISSKSYETMTFSDFITRQRG